VLKRSLTLTSFLVFAACGSNAPVSSAPGASGSATGGTSSAGGTNGGTSSAGSTNGGRTNAGGTDASSTNGGTHTAGYWKPQAGLTWQWQLSEGVDTPLEVDVYDIDWEADKATVDKLHTADIKVICYVSVGSWEDFRPDANDFPDNAIGNDYDGWPGEKYVDIRSQSLRAVMSTRFDTCKTKGFDAIEPDNMDVFELGSDSGFPLTHQDGIDYAHWLATAAHSRGMSIGQKNAASITADIAATYDWALTESCYSDGNWCGDVKAYAAANKPVFMCEYEAQSFAAACSAWKPKTFSPILKDLDLGAPITFCP
jgi:endo-alpha-1,4-polygalactosaminidase (GH114 family)